MGNLSDKIFEKLQACHAELVDYFKGRTEDLETRKASLLPKFIGTEAESLFYSNRQSDEIVAKALATTYLWGAAGLTWERGKKAPCEMMIGYSGSKEIFDKHLSALKNASEFRNIVHSFCQEKGNVLDSWHYRDNPGFYNFHRKEGPFIANTQQFKN